MICKDMKYTALYWALGFQETEQDVYRKSYQNMQIVIDAEEQTVDYGKDITVFGDNCKYLKRHKDFVVLECVDRLLNKGYLPRDIIVDGRADYADVCIKGADIFCEQWGEDYQERLRVGVFTNGKAINIVYTSRLVSGLLEYKTCIYSGGEVWDKGVFEPEVRPFFWKFSKHKARMFPEAEIRGFQIFERELVFYGGTDQKVVIPDGITSIAASAFWNNTYIEEVVLPQSLEQIGGDCFYYCKNLKRVNIPKNVRIMGNNPFAGCPNLEIVNESPYFLMKDGVLYNKDQTVIIYYPIQNPAEEFSIPEGVEIIGKHSFFACNNLKKITIPSSVFRLENNPFSGCNRLQVENHSRNYIFDEGIIYNKYLTSVIGCLNGTQAEEVILPETIAAINRNSFWNCKGIKKLVIPKNVRRIGYNPFAGCENMLLSGNPSGYFIQNGVVFSADKTAICCATDRAVGEQYAVPNEVRTINRGVFSGCRRLKTIALNRVICIDKSAFTDCTALETIYIPDTVTYIGEWAFAYCSNLRKVSIKRGTKIDRNAFNECPAEIIWRD